MASGHERPPRMRLAAPAGRQLGGRERRGGCAASPSCCARIAARVIVAFVSLVLATAASLAPPYLAKLAIDDGITPGDLGALNLIVAAFVGVGARSTGARRTCRPIWSAGSGSARCRTCGCASSRTSSASRSASSAAARPGVLISRLTNDVQALDQLVTDGIVTLFSSTLTLVGTVVILLLLDVQLALVMFLATFPLLAVGQHRVPLLRGGRVPAVREKIANVTAYLQETLSGVRIVRAFGQEPRHVERFAELNEEHRAVNYRTVQLNATYFPGVELLSSIGTAVILLYGGYQAIDGNITIGVLVAFVGYLQSFFDPIQQLSNLYVDLPAGHGGDRQDLRPARHRAGHAGRAGRARRWARSAATSSSTDVWFSYDEAGRDDGAQHGWALRDVSLRRPGGRDARARRRDRAPASRRWRSWSRASTTRSGAPCGWTGTTCARSRRRACAASSASCRRRASCSPGTVRENIEFGRPGASELELVGAAKAVGAHEFIKALPDGYETEVGERGSRLSAGPAAARRAGAGADRRPADPGAGRGDRERRRARGGGDRGGAAEAARRAAPRS